MLILVFIQKILSKTTYKHIENNRATRATVELSSKSKYHTRACGKTMLENIVYCTLYSEHCIQCELLTICCPIESFLFYFD